MNLHEVRDPAAMRVFLEEDPLRLSSIINKLFYDTIWRQDDDYILLVDDPEAPKNWILKGTNNPRLEMRVTNEFAREYIDSLPVGEFIEFGNIERNVYDLVKEKFELEMDEACVEVILAKEDFKPKIDHEIITLNEEDAETIDEHWGLVPDFAWYFRQRIKQSSTFGIREDGELIGWMGTYWETDKYAQLGYLHVKEGHRRGGLAFSITSALCQDIFDRGKTPVAHAFDTNTASLKLAEKMGFKRIGEKFWAKGKKLS
jgi:RimJ/RimL family protein N-acetyltransferase